MGCLYKPQACGGKAPPRVRPAKSAGCRIGGPQNRLDHRNRPDARPAILCAACNSSQKGTHQGVARVELRAKYSIVKLQEPFPRMGFAESAACATVHRGVRPLEEAQENDVKGL